MVSEIEKDSLAGEAPNAPVTHERSVRDDLDDKIPKPCKLCVCVASDFLEKEPSVKKATVAVCSRDCNMRFLQS